MGFEIEADGRREGRELERALGWVDAKKKKMSEMHLPISGGAESHTSKSYSMLSTMLASLYATAWTLVSSLRYMPCLRTTG
jgi:hypothetical protein